MHELVKLQEISPRIFLEILYATPDNFTGKCLYDRPCCFLIRRVAERLHLVQLALEKRGLGLKVFDGYRPLSIQKKLWALVPDPRYVADPSVGSKHNRGSAVDVTLIDRQGKELSMPSLFDEFTERAHRTYQGGSQESLAHRQWLEDAMGHEGFVPFPTEWWHFDDPNWKDYPILDISFEELEWGDHFLEGIDGV